MPRKSSRIKAIRLWSRRVLTPLVFLGVLSWLVAGYTISVPAPPANPNDLCDIFEEHPKWYDHAAASEQRWGTPIPVQMAFVYYESSFRSHIRPPRQRLFDAIPWSRPTTAYGYAQALDPAWADYMQDAGSVFATRDQIRHALDFIGWYNARTRSQVGIDQGNAEHLYLAYHEGPTGYERGYHLKKPAVQALADRVGRRAERYAGQLRQCDAQLRCRRWYQFGPFCE